MEYAEALWAYQGTEANEISFPAGAQLAILRKVSAEWWEAQYEGRVGYFPATYVRVVSGTRISAAGRRRRGVLSSPSH